MLPGWLLKWSGEGEGNNSDWIDFTCKATNFMPPAWLGAKSSAAEGPCSLLPLLLRLERREGVTTEKEARLSWDKSETRRGTQPQDGVRVSLNFAP